MSAAQPVDPEPVDEGSYRLALGRFATGVTVVTTVAGGQFHAMTASSLASVSLDPPLVLVCVEKEARFHDAIVEAGSFGVSILGEHQRAAAQWFATRGRPVHGQLDRTPHTIGAVTGSPLLDGSLSQLECVVTDIHPGGDHSIVVGLVVSAEVTVDADAALVHYRSRYDHLA
ncbi:putative reductase [Nostocoides japonicum T1-X7]|uniref:Putative reductase n=1 Tax=Nostocoides japonicum T1-X7 TaxID=1194083 RepID=A0A077M0D4_9MICO|nr:flavin reductase family protein [Tetrasphaera japonica]CCH77670.1 putative reductase [Tetrasphaera japonica T1-X7]